VALPFRTYAGTLQGELDACQRYYEKNEGTIFLTTSNGGFANSYTSQTPFKVTKRGTPTVTVFSGASQTGTSGSATWYTGATGTVAAVDFEGQETSHFSFRRTGTNTYSLVTFSFTASAVL
jgi:hypothetical protein